MVIEQNGPGLEYKDFPVKTFYFGIKRGSDPVDLNGTTIQFDDGLITTPLTDDILQALAVHTWTNPDHFLTVVRTVVLNDDGATTHNVYTQELKDGFGKTVATLGKPSSTENIIARYYYDILGNLTTEIAPKPVGATINDTRYTYNTLGQLINKYTPDGGWFGYAYSPTGQLACDTSRNESGSTIYRIRRYQFDDLGRDTAIQLKNVNDLTNDVWATVVRNYYDNVDELSKNLLKFNIPSYLLSSLENLNDRLVASVAVNTVNGSTYYVCDLFSYDDEGRIEKKIKIVPGLPYQQISYTYDLQGKVLTETTECGGENIVKNYQYDDEGRLINVFHANNVNDGELGKTLASYSYDDLGRMNHKILGIGNGYQSGYQIDYTYNIRDWVDYNGPASGNAFVNRFSEHTYKEASGKIKHAEYGYYYYNSGPENNVNLTYAYDDANRLTGVTPGSGDDYTASYSYDVLGRFKTKREGTKTIPGYWYYTGTSRLMNTKNNNTDKEYYYDTHGNLVVDKIKKMVIEYDWRDMPVAFRFYNEIPSGIWEDGKGTVTYPTGADLYGYIKSEINKSGATTSLLSQVVMLYDASGNRVLKMEGK